MTDSSGNEVSRYDDDPYGRVINQQEQSGLNNPWKFAGGYLDSSTSLYKFGTRYYNPALGKWTQQGPVGGSLGDSNAANRYTYANDAPVNVTDQSGKCTAHYSVSSLGLQGEEMTLNACLVSDLTAGIPAISLRAPPAGPIVALI